MPVVKTGVTVSFVLKEPKIHLDNSNNRNETLIVFRVSSGKGINKRFSTGFKINPKYWDSGKQRVRNVAAVSNSLVINNNLDSLKNDFNKLIADKISNKVIITSDIIKEVYKSVSNKNLVAEREEQMTFFKFCNIFIEKKKVSLPKKRGGKSETVGVYEQAIKHLKEFQEDENYEVDFNSIDLEFYYEFREYMQTKEKKDGTLYSANTIGKHIKTLKTILNAATYEGYNTNLKYKHPEFKIVNEITTAIYLTNDELMDMFELDLSNNKNQEKARDIFLIGCEIGQRVSDYNNLQNCEITKHNGDEYFVITQKKTGNIVHCIITPAIRSIMNTRYDGKPPSKMSEPYINKYIKEVGEEAKINEKIVFKRTQGGVLKETRINKYDLISTHTARRSYATNKYRAGVPVHDILPLTGHKSERELLKYIRENGMDKAARIVNTKPFRDSYMKVV